MDVTDRQTLRLKRLLDLAVREGDFLWIRRLTWGLEANRFGPKDQGQWKPRLKEDWND